jgi:hypothetical protein
MLVETRTVLINDLRFALEVMEDCSHLGLNDERAGKLKTLMEHRILEAEKTLILAQLSSCPTSVRD